MSRGSFFSDFGFSYPPHVICQGRALRTDCSLLTTPLNPLKLIEYFLRDPEKILTHPTKKAPVAGAFSFGLMRCLSPEAAAVHPA